MKKLLTITLIFLCIISYAYASTIETHNWTFPSSTQWTANLGWNFTATNDIILGNITIDQTCEDPTPSVCPTQWFLFYQNNLSSIGNGTITNYNGIANIQLVKDNKYILVAGDSFSRVSDIAYGFNDSVVGYPHVGENIEITSGVWSLDGLSFTYSASAMYVIENIIVFLNFTTPVFQSPTPPDNNINNSQIVINVSCSSGNVTLWVDNSSNPVTKRLNNLSTVGNWTSDFSGSGTKYYKASCNSDTNSSVRTFNYDIVVPQIEFYDSSFFNLDNSSNISTVSVNKNISISYTDNRDLFAYDLNFTNASGYTMYYFSNISLSGVSVNISKFINFSNWSIGGYNFSTSVTDSHTVMTIGDYEIITKNKEVTFDTDENNLITITSAKNAIVNTYKKADRYEFEYSFKKDIFGNVADEKKFTVKCDNELIYRPGSIYAGHFICWNGKEGNWIDFEGTGEIPTIKEKKELFTGKIYYTVTFTNQKTVMRFNSIGGLNRATLKASFNISSLFPTDPWLEIGTIDGGREWSYGGVYNLRRNESLNITSINKILNNNCNCIGCSIIGSDCRVPFTFHSDTEGSLKVEITNLTYEYGIDNCTEFNYTIFNMTYVDEITTLPITVDNGYDLVFTGLFTQNVNGTFSGHTTDSFCTNLNPEERAINWTIIGGMTLTKSDYGTQIIDITAVSSYLSANAPVLNKSFTMIRLNESSTVLFTWLTTTYKVIDGVMEIYRCAGDGSRTFVGSTPIIDGAAPVNIELLNTPYSYEIIVDGTRYTDDTSFTKCHIETETTRRFLVDIEGVDVTPVIGLYSIPCNVTKTGNNTVKLEWGENPEDSSTITGCMQAFRHTVAGTTKVYENCSSTANSILATIPVSGFDYSVKGKLFQSGRSISCMDTVEFKADLSTPNLFGPMAALSVFFLIIGWVLWFSDDANAQQLGAIGALIVSFISGLLAFGWQTVVSLSFFVIIVWLVGRYSKKS